MNRLLRSAAVAVLLGAVVTCGKDQTGPPISGPGVVELSLTTPAADDGGLLFTLDGPVVGNFERARDDVLVFSHRAASGLLRVAVVGHGLSGPLLKLTVPDVAAIDGYALTIQEVAGSDNALRDDLSGYRLTLAP